jgi:uncharacterized protein
MQHSSWKIEFMKGYDYYSIKAKTKGPQGESWGIDGGLMKRKMKGQPFMNYVFVDSVDVLLKKAKANGGKIAMPKTPIGDMGAIGAFIDTEGNLIGLHEMTKAPAKKKAAAKKKR